MNHEKEHSAWLSAAFFMANLLFVGVFYVALWCLYFFRYKQVSTISQSHIKQALIAGTISTLIFVLINVYIQFSGGYDNIKALIALEIYFMAVVPLFFLVGILAFVKAITHSQFTYPIIGRFIDKGCKP